MTVDKQLVEKHFSRRVASYDAVTRVQADMRRGLLLQVDARFGPGGCDRVLEIGCGTGALTAALRQRLPHAAIDAIDISAPMVDAARRRIGQDFGIRWHVGDAEVPSEALTSAGPFDLVVSNATMQWFDDPIGAVRAYRHLLASDGMLALTTFGPETFRELRAVLAAVEPDGPERIHRLPSSGEWRQGLARCRPQRDAAVTEDLRQATYNSVRDFLDAVRRTGASHAGGRKPPLRRSVYEALCRRYAERYRNGDGRVPATYHCLFIRLG